MKGKRGTLYVALTVLVAAAAPMTYWVVHRQPAAPAPPVVELKDTDPAIAGALGAARAAIVAAPRSAEAWGKMGMLLINYNFQTQARECFEQAQRLDPLDLSWPYYCHMTLTAVDPAAALVKLREAAALAGDRHEAPRLRLAEMLLEWGQAEEAEALLRQVLAANPTSPRAHFALGKLDHERGDLNASLEHLTVATTSPSCERAAHALLAQVRQRLGDFAGAEEARRRAVAAVGPSAWPDPFLDKLNRYRVGRQMSIGYANDLLAARKPDEAAAVLEEVVRDYPANGLGWLLLGETRMEQHQYPAAEAALRRAVELMPESVEARFGLGADLFQQGRHAEAADCFRKTLELKPSSATACLNLGQCLVQLSNDAGAREAFQKAVDFRPQFAEAHRALGEVLARAGQREQAIEHLEIAVQLNSDDATARKLLDELRKPGGGNPKPAGKS